MLRERTGSQQTALDCVLELQERGLFGSLAERPATGPSRRCSRAASRRVASRSRRRTRFRRTADPNRRPTEKPTWRPLGGSASVQRDERVLMARAGRPHALIVRRPSQAVLALH